MISVWSTPRSGSIILSKQLAVQHGYTLFNEPLSVYLKDKYSYLENNFMRLSDSHIPGCFYLDCRKSANNEVFIFKNFSKKEKNFQYKIKCKLKNNNSNVLAHHHLNDIKKKDFEFIFKISKKNIYIKRASRKNQLASWAISLSENKWVNFGAQSAEPIKNEIVDINSLTEFFKKIILADTLALDKNFDIITYDECEITQLGINKMSTDSFSRLCETDQKKLIEILEKQT